MNHMPGSCNSLFNNSTRRYSIYCFRWMPYKWFSVCFPCSTQSFFCCKIKSYMQCYFLYRVLSQNLLNKTKHCWVKNKVMYLFLFSCFRIFPPFSLKVGYINSGLFRHSSIRPPVRLSVIQPVCDTIRPLGFCNKLSYLNTLWPILILRSKIKGQGNKFLHYVSFIYKHFIE